MEDKLFSILHNLLINYEENGYFIENEVSKILFICFVRNMLMYDIGFLEDKDIRIIERAINELFNSSCINKLEINENKCC